MSSLSRRLALLFLALGFLTRLAPGRKAEPAELGASLPCFPVVGLILGLLLVAPFAFGLLAGHGLIQGWLFAICYLWATRGLHWDGWCDIWDAWGSSARGDRFFVILKDSRVGAFGVMGLVLGLGGQVLLFGECLQHNAFGVCVWAMVLGRTAQPVLAWADRDLARPGLAAIFLAQATGRATLVALGAGLAMGVFLAPLAVLGTSLGLAAVGLAMLHVLARSRGGLNGDFLGAAGVWAELSAPLAYLVVEGCP